MPLKLYYAPGACSFVPHAMLEAAGATFEPVPIRLHKGEQASDAYLALNPRGQVPVLVRGEQVVTQIIAIVSYIDGLFPESRFIPLDALERARFYEVLAWMNNTVHPTFTHIFMPHKFTADAAAQAQIKQHALGQYREQLGELQALVAAAHARGDDWLGGAHAGPLDAYALTLLRWGTIAGIDPTLYATLWAYVQRVAQAPAMARAIEREKLQLNLFKPA